MTTTLWSGNCASSRGPMMIPSGTLMCPSERPMFVFLRIERPTRQTLRPSAAAASTHCCTRWMFDANDVTTMRPLQRLKTSSRFGPATFSLGAKPGRSPFVESPQSSSSPSRPSSARRVTSAGLPSTGVWSNL